jgi:hypothetical protein
MLSSLIRRAFFATRSHEEHRRAPGSTGVTFIAPGDAAVSFLVCRLPMGV